MGYIAEAKAELVKEELSGRAPRFLGGFLRCKDANYEVGEVWIALDHIVDLRVVKWDKKWRLCIQSSISDDYYIQKSNKQIVKDLARRIILKKVEDDRIKQSQIGGSSPIGQETSGNRKVPAIG